MTVIDFGQLMKEAGEGFQPVPTGPYNAEVTKATATTSSTGKPMIKVTLRIVGGPHEGRQLFDQFVITAGNPNALAFFFEHMAAFGLDRAYFAQNPPMESVAAALVGRQVMVSVGVREFKGADRNEVQAYKPIAGGQVGVPVAATPTGFGPGAAAPAPVPQVAPAPAPAPVPAPPAPAAPAPAPQPAPAQAAPPAPAPVAPPPAAIVPPPADIAPPQPAPAPAPVAAPAPVPAPAPEPAAPAVPAPVPPAAYSSADEEPF